VIEVKTGTIAATPRHITIIRPPGLTLNAIRRRLALLPRYRHLLAALTAHRIKVRYKQSALGPLWAILQPLAMMVIFAVVFSTIVRIPSSGHPYALFAYTGLLPWTAFASALGSAAGSLVSHAALVTRVYFPREILPLTYVLMALFDLAVASTVLAGLLLWYGVPITLAALWVLPMLLLLGLLAFAVSLILCAVNVRFRDVGVAMPLLLQLGLFVSPVVYPLDAVPADVRDWYVLNPMVGIVDGFRRAVLDGLAPDPVAITASIVVVAILLPVAYVWFTHVEATMADSI
jgi:lipopolysaccharide transport system permease protein